MFKIKKYKYLNSLEKAVILLKNNNYYFLGEFIREINNNNDELIVVLENEGKKVILTCEHKNNEKLPKISKIFYIANIFENEMYDFYGKDIEPENNHILRLHNYKKDYFPKRKLGKPTIKEKNEFIFTKVNFKGATKVQVGPIHAGVIPPGHFRFTVDGEDILNLDIQLGWKHRGIEDIFTKESKLEKLVKLSEEIVGDSKIANSISFVKMLERSSDIRISKQTKLNRIILLELERIYNHLWTSGAILNDIGQGYLLNGFLEIREEFLKRNEKVFGNRLLSNVINLGKNNIYINEKQANSILRTIKKTTKRLINIEKIAKHSSGIYDRLSTTGIVKKDTAIIHSALGVVAKASGIKIDFRLFDSMYKNIENININTGENGDVYDRFIIRLKEIEDSFSIIKQAIKKLEMYGFEDNTPKINIKLQDGYFTGRTEGHRGTNLMLTYIENSEIKYFKFKDPSFTNWTLLEYAVLDNTIGDFPVCNKSFDLSYSGFDI